jgi:asparagine synthase (glutamine-hydrolysing)
LRCLPGYASLALARRRARIGRHSWVAPEIGANWRPRDYAPEHNLAERLRHSVEHSHLPVYLRVEDRNSMAHGVEERLPFLDHRLVALAFRLDADWKLRGGQTKVLLREAMRGRIPEAVRTRTHKFGFPTSVDAWFRGPLYGPLKDMIGSRVVRESGIWDLKRVNAALEQHRAGTLDAGESLFDVVQVCHWLQLLPGSMAAAPGRLQ